uniref:Uncharacterized protein n=1 Tax=Glossina austeni TaxID=7395 RepID=A0A1A9VW51_GLOAU
MYTNNNNFVATAAVGSTAPLLTGERPSLSNSFGIQFKHAFLTSLSTQLENPLNARSVNKTNAKQELGKRSEVFEIFMRLGTHEIDSYQRPGAYQVFDGLWTSWISLDCLNVLKFIIRYLATDFGGLIQNGALYSSRADLSILIIDLFFLSS